ncbi:TA2R9 protein, partial [Neodrepanis coruscans]|nr:TA2R9 protein [Neodrepanis coruscans]
SKNQFNATTFDAIVVAIITLEGFAGTWINVFLVSVLCMDWVKRKTLNSNEKMLLLLGCCRSCYLSISWIYNLFSIIYPKYFYVVPILQLVVSIQSSLNDFSLCVSACLCVFYCIKIANFRNSLFIYLKVKIDRTVPWLLLGSVLFSLVIGIVVYDITDKALCKNLNETCQVCVWKASIRREEHFFPVFLISGFVFVSSFMAVIFSALLLLFSLWRHKCNMQINSTKDFSMDAHIRAMKSILFFLIIYSINFIVLILMLIYSMKNQIHLFGTFSVFLDAFPVFHSLILILSKPKLKNTMLKILPCVKCKDLHEVRTVTKDGAH